jgi:uncharacterized protein
MVLRLFSGTETVPTIHEIDYERLYAEGKRLLLFDLDNTLGKRGMRDLPARSLSLLLSLQHRGFRVGVLTNRRRNAEDPAVRVLRRHMPVVHAAGKPRRRGFIELLEDMGGRGSEAVMIGDRRLTDVLGGHRMGLNVIRVRGA